MSAARFKTCSTCQLSQPVTDFYSRRNPDGGERIVYPYCKACWKVRMKSTGYESQLRANERSALAEPQKHRARQALRNAVSRGVIIRGPCERCGTPKADAHHNDYAQPLVVRWLCRPCHAAHHREEAIPRKPQQEEVGLLRPPQAAKQLGVTVRTLQRWVEAGVQIPCVLTGKRRRYVADRLDDWKMNRDRRVI